MAFTLPPLPYPADALEVAIDKLTMEIHHDKHHKAYVDNLNAAVAGHPDLESKPIDQLMRDIAKVPESIRQKVINNGGGHANHSFFWELMAPNAGGAPTGDLASAIASTFGDLATLKTKMKEAGLGRFGSGWSWLVVGADKKLAIESTANQDTPLMTGKTPVLGIDVWEHAYYLRYQNRRADYLEAWWNVVNWKSAAAHFAKAGK
jgi:superoxide dismutase, Fe-Mn family